jgi:predicted nicotinamide N-methyase
MARESSRDEIMPMLLEKRKAPLLSRNHTAFIRANTRLTAVPFVPEISLYLAGEAMALWEKTEADLVAKDLPPPFWAFAWAGGQALARYILDHPHVVANQNVLDFASGSGICAVAAAKAGAAFVQAVDIDPYAAAAGVLNAQANSVSVTGIQDDLVGLPGPWTVILAGDISYQKDMAGRVHAWLAEETRRGVTVLIGDPGRAYLPLETLRELADYDVPVMPSLEDADVKNTRVFTVDSGAA